MLRSGRTFANQQRDLTFDFAVTQLRQYFSRASANKLLMHLSQLAGNDHGPLRSENLNYIFHSLADAPWSFIHHNRRLKVKVGFQDCPARSGLGGQKSVELKGVGGQ